MLLFVKLLQAFLMLLPSICAASDPFVNTELGRIVGKAENFQGQKVDAYLGVPYAQNPGGEMRFKVPKIVTKRWSGDLLAQKLAESCIQTPDGAYKGFRGSEMWNSPTNLTEDCLNLNIWVPETKTGEVIVWIFGGGFFSGSPSLSVYEGTALAAKTGAIVVNINYRVGPFGFLYFGDNTTAPGNMGLLDQQVALQWINENIHFFGGDASKVTLFGESAGAASVTAHLAAPGSHEYFNKIILNSGSIRHIWASESKERMLSLSEHLAARLNCTTETKDKESILNCMRQKPADVVQAVSGELWSFVDILSFPFVPIREDVNFFKGNFHSHFVNKTSKKNVSVIIGEVTDEGTFWLPYYFSDYGFTFNNKSPSESDENAARINETQYEESFHALMTYFRNSSKAQEILSEGYKKASNSSKKAERLRDGVAQFVGDFFFACGVREFADLLVSIIDGKVFKYTFTMRSSANPWPKWMGVMHGYEIEYEFGQPLLNDTFYASASKEKEKKFSEDIIELFKSFIGTGTPSDYWTPYNTEKRPSLELGEDFKTKRNILENVRGDYCELINEARKVADNEP